VGKRKIAKTIISQREGEKEELAGKGIEKEKEVRFSVDIDILEEVKREIKECKDGFILYLRNDFILYLR